MALFDIKNRTRAFGAIRRWQGQGGTWYSDTHKGDDYAETYGNDDVYAIRDAKVYASGHSTTYGWYVWTRDLKNSSLVVKYHMLNERGYVPVGGLVYAGKTRMGRTGASAANASGNHVHIQVELNGIPVDPRPYIVGSLAGGGSTPIDNTPPKAPSVPVDNKELNDMLMIHIPAGEAGNPDKTQALYAVFGTGFWLQFVGEGVASGFATQIGGNSVKVSAAFFAHCKKAADAGLPVAAIVEGGALTVDVNAIAQAVNNEAAARLTQS